MVEFILMISRTMDVKIPYVLSGTLKIEKGFFVVERDLLLGMNIILGVCKHDL